MKRLNHPNVIRLHEVIDDPDSKRLYLAAEYAKNGILCKSAAHDLSRAAGPAALSRHPEGPIFALPGDHPPRHQDGELLNGADGVVKL